MIENPDREVPSVSAPGTGVGLRFSVAFASVVLVVLAGSLVGLDRLGVSSRTVPAVTTVVVVDDARGLLSAWRAAGVHGAVLVHASRDLGYLAPPVTILPNPTGWPVPEHDVAETYRRAVERPNVVWVAGRTGIARSVIHLLTPMDLADKVRVGRERGFPGISADGTFITANDEGFIRSVSQRLPDEIGTPAVLHIDASYFVNGTPEQLAAQLGDSLGSYSLVTLDRATDTTAVPEAARLQVDRMADMLREPVDR